MVDRSVLVQGRNAVIPENTEIPLDMDRFRGVSNDSGGPAKSNRFLVQIEGGPFADDIQQDLMFLCEAAELPGRGFMSTDIRYYGPNFKAPYQTVYEDLNLTFICRDQFKERKFFDDWLDYINPVRSFNFTYKDNYTTQIRLHQFSEIENKATYSFTFEKAYPILVSPQPATWADDNFHRLTVSFTYWRWYRENLDVINPANPDTSRIIADRLSQLNILEGTLNNPGGIGGYI
jgi:hypothetical protein